MSGSRVAAVILAAGAATRFGSAKQVLLLPTILERVRAAGIDEIVVVEGAHPLGASLEGARVVSCSDWQNGPGASLRAGLAALPATMTHAVVVLADGPTLAPLAIGRVVAAVETTGCAVAAASYEGQRGHPVVVARESWHHVPNEGLRSIPAHLVPCDDLGEPGDVDTPADLAAYGGPADANGGLADAN